MSAANTQEQGDERRRQDDQEQDEQQSKKHLEQGARPKVGTKENQPPKSKSKRKSGSSASTDTSPKESSEKSPNTAQKDLSRRSPRRPRHGSSREEDSPKESNETPPDSPQEPPTTPKRYHRRPRDPSQWSPTGAVGSESPSSQHKPSPNRSPRVLQPTSPNQPANSRDGGPERTGAGKASTPEKASVRMTLFEMPIPTEPPKPQPSHEPGSPGRSRGSRRRARGRRAGSGRQRWQSLGESEVLSLGQDPFRRPEGSQRQRHRSASSAEDWYSPSPEVSEEAGGFMQPEEYGKLNVLRLILDYDEKENPPKPRPASGTDKWPGRGGGSYQRRSRSAIVPQLTVQGQAVGRAPTQTQGKGQPQDQDPVQQPGPPGQDAPPPPPSEAQLEAQARAAAQIRSRRAGQEQVLQTSALPQRQASPEDDGGEATQAYEILPLFSRYGDRENPPKVCPVSDAVSQSDRGGCVRRHSKPVVVSQLAVQGRSVARAPSKAQVQAELQIQGQAAAQAQVEAQPQAQDEVQPQAQGEGQVRGQKQSLKPRRQNVTPPPSEAQLEIQGRALTQIQTRRAVQEQAIQAAALPWRRTSPQNEHGEATGDQSTEGWRAIDDSTSLVNYLRRHNLASVGSDNRLYVHEQITGRRVLIPWYTVTDMNVGGLHADDVQASASQDQTPSASRERSGQLPPLQSSSTSSSAGSAPPPIPTSSGSQVEEEHGSTGSSSGQQTQAGGQLSSGPHLGGTTVGVLRYAARARAVLPPLACLTRQQNRSQDLSTRWPRPSPSQRVPPLPPINRPPPPLPPRPSQSVLSTPPSLPPRPSQSVLSTPPPLPPRPAHYVPSSLPSTVQNTTAGSPQAEQAPSLSPPAQSTSSTPPPAQSTSSTPPPAQSTSSTPPPVQSVCSPPTVAQNTAPPPVTHSESPPPPDQNVPLPLPPPSQNAPPSSPSQEEDPSSPAPIKPPTSPPQNKPPSPPSDLSQ